MGFGKPAGLDIGKQNLRPDKANPPMERALGKAKSATGTPLVGQKGPAFGEGYNPKMGGGPVNKEWYQGLSDMTDHQASPASGAHGNGMGTHVPDVSGRVGKFSGKKGPTVPGHGLSRLEGAMVGSPEAPVKVGTKLGKFGS